MDVQHVTGPQWLDDDEMRAWRTYIETVNDLTLALERDLEPHGLTTGDYQVLVFLSEADDEQMRMCDLAADLHVSPSGLTRRLDGLVRAGLVERIPSATDRRVMLAVLTEAGRRRLEQAAPDHVASVRRHLIDRLTPAQVQSMGDIFDAIRAGFARAPR